MFTIRKYFKNIIFILYATIVFFIYFSGIIKKMIHPRMYTFILISGFILLLFFFVEVAFLKKEKLKRIKISNIFYIAPVILIFFINDANLSSRLIKNKGIDIGVNSRLIKEKSQDSTENQNSKDIIPNNSENNDKDEGSNNNEVITEEPVDLPVEPPTEFIELKDDNFLMQIAEIHYELDKYIGKGITYTGFIYRDETMSSNQFVVGRLGMTCCAADAGLVGFLSTYVKYSELKDKEWYQIKAVIDKTLFKDSYGEDILPYLKIYEVIKVNPPSDEYVY